MKAELISQHVIFINTHSATLVQTEPQHLLDDDDYPLHLPTEHVSFLTQVQSHRTARMTPLTQAKEEEVPCSGAHYQPLLTHIGSVSH